MFAIQKTLHLSAPSNSLPYHTHHTLFSLDDPLQEAALLRYNSSLSTPSDHV
jgi:hypothetical protein